MRNVPKEDPPLPYPRVKHHTRWRSCPLSEEYLIPPEDKPQLLEQLYPFVGVPSLDEKRMDLHENQEFFVRDFKVVRESGMNMLVSPYYYRSGGSVIDWMPVDLPPDDEEDPDEDDDHGDDWKDDDDSVDSMSVQRVKPDGGDRLAGLMARQHEGPGL